MTSPGPNPNLLQALMRMASPNGPQAPPLPPGAGLQPSAPMMPEPQPVFQPGTGQFNLVQAINEYNAKMRQEELAKQQLSHRNDMESQQAAHENSQDAAEGDRMHQIGMNRLQHLQAGENTGLASKLKSMNP